MSDSEEVDQDIINGLMDQEEGQREERDRLNRRRRNDNCNGSTNTNGRLNNIKLNTTYKNKNETLRKRFSGDDDVRVVALAIADQITGNVDSVDNHGFGAKKRMLLHFQGKPLNFDHKLSSIEGIKGDECQNLTIFVSFKVIGGAQVSYDEKKDDNNNNNNNKSKRKRLANFKKEKRIKATLKPDCIYGWDDKKSLRVKMPCGHVFAPLTLFKLTQMYVNSLTKSQIQCPIVKCKQIWPFDVIIAAADLDENEALKFDSILRKRAMLHSGNFQECKGCKGLINKPDDLQMIRVRCASNSCKNRSDICWFCGENWTGGGFIVCGNKDCGTHRINNLLQTCKMVNIGGKQCPEFRHCPKCLTIVGWESNCKHIRCWGCKHEFCFICLSKWPCAGGNSCAVPHARQSLK